MRIPGFTWGNALMAGAPLSIASVSRTAMDWRFPTADFRTRAIVSTTIGIGILLVAGFWAGRRSGSVAAGTIMGVGTAAVAASLTILGTAILLGVWHDPKTMAAIHGSGGLEEVFTLPLMLILPGVLLGTIGGALGAFTNRLRLA